MKAITISQPYASMIADGLKWIENRTWPTSYRGELAIHAGKGLQYLTREELNEYPNGCVIAIARLTACVSFKQIEEHSHNSLRELPLAVGAKRLWKEAAAHVHAEGPWCWVLEGTRKIQPVACRGAQGLWDWSAQ